MTVSYGAPGRVNLIGEHTDYNLGFALPIALPRRTVVTFTPEHTGAITARSDRADGSARIPLDTTPGQVTGWAAYAAGAIWALRGAGHPVPGGAMSITSDVEIGSGLSSSAALIGAVLGAVGAATGTRIDRLERARLAQRAENDYVGAPTGLLDHLAALFGAPKTALLIDFRDITVRPVAFDPDACDVVLLLMDSRARHCHAGGEYALRRASCERAAADLGVSSLRAVQDRGLAALGAIADPIDARRARHVLTENQRVLDFAAALADSDFTAAGQLLTASHESMREDFAITTERIDLIAESAVRAGALGARMTGGGFGGAVIALVPADRARDVADTVRRAAVTAGYDEPAVSAKRAKPQTPDPPRQRSRSRCSASRSRAVADPHRSAHCGHDASPTRSTATRPRRARHRSGSPRQDQRPATPVQGRRFPTHRHRHGRAALILSQPGVRRTGFRQRQRCC